MKYLSFGNALHFNLFVSGKIGYGTASEALAYKLPFVFVRRDYFNEEPFLRNLLEVLLSMTHSYSRASISSLQLPP